MAKIRSNGSLPEMGASCVEELPICISGATALDDEATGFVFGAISTVNSVSKTKERRKKFGAFLKFRKSSMLGSVEKKRV